MPDDFDAFHEWLGIPPREQPPNHYRLLGIPLFEDKPAVIEHAADRQMAHLRTFQSGKHSDQSQRLLNEVAAARICLLKPAKKAVYDQTLREQVEQVEQAKRAEQAEQAAQAAQAAQSEGGSLDPAMAGLLETLQHDALPSVKHAVKPRPHAMLGIAGGVVAAVLVLASLWWVLGRDSGPGPRGVAKAPIPGADSGKDGPPKPTYSGPEKLSGSKGAGLEQGTKSPQGNLPPPPPAPPPGPQGGAGNGPNPQPPAGGGTTPQGPPTAGPAGPQQVPPAEEPPVEEEPARKIELPPADQQQRLAGMIDDLYEVAKAKDSAAKQALARKLLEAGLRSGPKPAEQFVLLRRAGELARDAGDPDAALAAVDAMNDAGFDIVPWRAKAVWLEQLAAKSPPSGAAGLASLARACVELAEQATADEALEEASKVIGAARGTLADAKKRAVQSARAARVAIVHTRAPAERAAREQKAKEADAEAAALDGPLAAVIECAQGIQEAAKEHEAVSTARERLKTAPDDPAACLAVGRWECFYRDDWGSGLLLLSKGSDAPLKSLAAGDLGEIPAKPADQVARGDAWWEQAEKSSGRTKTSLRRRAGSWYQEALPQLGQGLVRVKVESRLGQVPEPPPLVESPRGHGPPLAVAPFGEAAAKQHQSRWAKYLGVPVEFTNSIGMKFVLIPPGEFEMGSTKEFVNEQLSLAGDAGTRKRLLSESPRHRVRITRPFWLATTEVTQQHFARVMNYNPSTFGSATKPVDGVPWPICADFCRRLSELPEEHAAKRSYELPTEAQWEYACRAGNPGPWFFSGRPQALPASEEGTRLGEYAWLRNQGENGSKPVGQKLPSRWGLQDIYGNLWEWCRDWYDPDYYAKSPVMDPPGPSAGSEHVFRGGAMDNDGRSCRSAYRNFGDLNFRSCCVGFRVALKIDEEALKQAAESVRGGSEASSRSAGGRAATSGPPPAVAPFDEKTAKQHQAAWAEYLREPVVETNSIGMKFVLIPPGEFEMGSPPDVGGEVFPDELPRHRVRITKPFRLGVTEVTQEQYTRVMGNNPSQAQGDVQRPVEKVSWNDCVEFCRRLSELPEEKAARRRYELPTEAQWEYACRAGNPGPCFFSSQPNPLPPAKDSGLAAQYTWRNNEGGQHPKPVGQKLPSPWGLYDIYGNVWEWCRDWYASDYYAKSPAVDPPGPAEGSNRVFRGSCFGDWTANYRSAWREKGEPGKHHYCIGFRIALQIDEAKLKPPRTLEAGRSADSLRSSRGTMWGSPIPIGWARPR